MATMNISLPDKLKAFVEDRVAEGHYANVSDYVRDILRREQERHKANSQNTKDGEAGDISDVIRRDKVT